MSGDGGEDLGRHVPVGEDVLDPILGQFGWKGDEFLDPIDIGELEGSDLAAALSCEDQKPDDLAVEALRLACLPDLY